MSISGMLIKAGILTSEKNTKLFRGDLDIEGLSRKPGTTTTVTVLLRDRAGNVLLCTGTTTPSSEAGYAKGCTFIKTNAGAGTSGTYTNIGTTTSCSFSANVSAPPAAGAVGAVATGSTLVEAGSDVFHRTTITVATTLPAIAGGASLAVGKLLYTFPAGVVIVRSATISMSITQTQGHINADTPTVGLGTTIASGAVSVLSGTAAFQNIFAGTALANCTGTPLVKTALPPVSPFALIIEASGGLAHSLYFNAAAAWAASGDTAALLAGTVAVDWEFLG